MLSTTSGAKDARQYPRKNFRARVVLFHGKESEVTEAYQLGEGGMLFSSRLQLQVGDSITIHFSLNDAYLRARADVLYILQSDGRTRVGISFKSLFGEYREIIRRYTT